MKKRRTTVPDEAVTAAPQSRPKLTADGYIAAAQSAATKHEYANDVRYFCERGGSIPATPEQVLAYLVEVAPTLAVATLERRLVAIHKAHVDRGLDSPIKHLAGVNYLDRPATTILAGWKRGAISSMKLVSEPFA